MKLINTKLLHLFNQDNKRSIRLKGVFFTAISIFASKGTTMLISIISLPLTINYLGKERFGMMETVIALISIMTFADLGLGFGLQNRIAQLQGNIKTTKLDNAISTIFFSLIITSVIFTLIFFAVFNKINWANIFNVHSLKATEEASLSVLVFFVCFIIQIPFSIVQKIQNGFQQGYISEIWRSGGNIFGLIFLIIVINNNLGVPYIILAIYGSNTLFIILNFISYFSFKEKGIFPNIVQFDFSIFSELYKDGLTFFGLQIATIVLISSDRLIITQILGPTSIVMYSIGFRLATIFTTPVDAFVLPLLPAFNDAIINNDIGWIKKILSKSFKLIFLISGTFGIIMIVFGNIIIKYWVGANSELPSNILWAFGSFILFSNLNSMFSYIMLTPKFISKILIIFVISVIVAMFLKFIFVLKFGVSGVIWATIISMSVLFFSFSFIKLRQAEFI